MDDIKNIAKAFMKYGLRGFNYLWMRYVVAPRLLTRAGSLERKPRDDLSMHMLVGARDFIMGVWSLASFYRVMPEVGQLVIHSDGTLGEKHTAIIKRLFPSARIEDTKIFLKEHGALLDLYPTLKKFRETYKRFQIRIIDQYFLSDKKYRLFMDSDLLWFREPTELVDAIRAGVPRPLMMSNSEHIRMEFADGSITDDETSRPNGGLVLFRGDQLTPDKLSAFLDKCDYVHKRFGDQAWMAWCLKPQLLPESTYIIKGALTPSIVMRHYTAPQRLKFWFHGLTHQGVWCSILTHTSDMISFPHP